MNEELKEVMLDCLSLFFDEIQGEDWRLNEEQKEVYDKTREVLIINKRL